MKALFKFARVISYLLAIQFGSTAAATRPATAVAFVVNGFVIQATITDPGLGYKNAPEITFSGSAGAGAKAHSEIDPQGSLTKIVIDASGSGYITTPSVIIRETLNVAEVALIPQLTITNASGLTVEVQYTLRLKDPDWTILTNLTINSDPYLFIDYANPANENRFYRVQPAGAAVSPNPNTNYLASIPSGTFVMGSPATESGRDPNESPQTTVTISRPYSIGKYEVTVGLWNQVMNPAAAPSEFTNTTAKVNINWNDATAFCTQYTEQERLAGRLPNGVVYRLPTEAEWEYACRAGTTTPYFFGTDSASLSQYAYFGNNAAPIYPVGQKLPNPWGLYDVYGNTWEMVYDVYAPYVGGAVTDPKGPASGTYRVVRGGCSAETTIHCRSATRGWNPPDARLSTFGQALFGFRVVLGQPIQ